MLVPENFITEGPNDEERGIFSCPSLSCDGLIFTSTDDCIDHNNKWHRGPYPCPDCDVEYACQPALDRHLKGTHPNMKWFCHQEDCEMEGLEFLNHTGYLDHVLSSASHQVGRVDVQITAPKVTSSPSEHNEDIVLDDAASVESAESSSTAVDFVCRVSCCHWLGRDFKCKSEWARHAGTHGHVSAAKLSKELEDQGLVGDELEAQQNAIRDFRCTAPHCPLHGQVFANSQSYSRHITTAVHCGTNDVAVETSSKKMDTNKKELRQCAVHGCPKYGYMFKTNAVYRKHTISGAHVAAERQEGSQAAILPSLDLKESDQQMTPRRPDDAFCMNAPLTPVSPLAHKGPSFSVKTPTARRTPVPFQLMSPSEFEYEMLEEKNRALEEEVRVLRETLARRDEQFDILVKILKQSENGGEKFRDFAEMA